MDDVVQRLRAGLDAGAIDLADIMDAADEIERLRQFETAAAVTEPMPAVVSGSGSVTPVPYVKHDEKRVDWHTAGGTNHDAAPAAKARTDADSDRTDKAVLRPGEGTGDSLSEAEIDALECVVEDGQIVGMSVYGVLRSLLVRLRPEWEGEDQEPERTHGVRHTQSECTKQAEGSVPDSKTQNEPVAWLVKGVEYDTGCEYEYVTNFKENAEAAAADGGRVVPLYGSPTLTDAEREALSWFTGGRFPVCPQHLATIRGLMARLS